MTPSFFGTKVVTDINLDDIYPLINTHSLFVGQWQFKRTKGSETAYQELIRQKAWPAFENWKKRCKDERILQPKIVYGYFDGAQAFERLGVRAESKMPFIPLQLVTMGDEVTKRCGKLFAAHQYTDYIYLHGLAVTATEALAEYCHRNILKELGIIFNKGAALPKGSRISPGYPIWPNITDQKKLCDLLGVNRIGVDISETYQLIPEYSTSAMIVIKQ